MGVDTVDTEGELLPLESKADIQGFVSSGWGHLARAAYLFIHFEDPAGARAWLDELRGRVTTARPWRTSPDVPKKKPERALGVALSFDGLETLGLSGLGLCSMPEAFRDGMDSPRRSAILGDSEDSAPVSWEVGSPRQTPVHALLVLKAADGPSIASLVERELRAMDAHAGVRELTEMRQGGYLPQDLREPFGFHDGIAQPRIRGLQRRGLATGSFVVGYPDHFGRVTPGPVVAPEHDPLGLLSESPNPHHRAAGLRDLGRNGTFLVYRKLRQDVAGFWRFLAEEAGRGGGGTDPSEVVWLAAKLVGRWPSGAPLVLAPDRDDPSLASADDFGYARLDPDGRRCPFGSHIRRSHPRDLLRPNSRRSSLNLSNAHRIIRRATVFGPPLFDHDILSDLGDRERLAQILRLEDDGVARGIHFFSVNASLEGQFELLQQNWCNNPSFNGVSGSKDPLIGDNDRPGKPPSSLRIPGRRDYPQTLSLPRFVTVLGGGYFFLPSLTALKYLASPR